MTTPPAFDFITDEEFRVGLEADHEEMLTCAEARAWKAVHVLAGSIIESVLVDYLVGQGKKNPDPLEMTLAQLITECEKQGVLSSKSAELSHVLKSYRNLIHPGRAKRLGEQADEEGAVVAQALVSMIIRDVAANQQATYGLTAEQIVNKFESDPTALGIAIHLLGEAPEPEIERLLVKALPARYFEEFGEDDPEPVVFERLTKLFRIAFDMTTDSVRTKVMSRYVKVLKEEPGLRVQTYEEEFFRGRDLTHVAKKDRELVKQHLLARLNEEPSTALIAASEGIGTYLVEKDITVFVDSLVRMAIGRENQEIGKAARSRLEAEAHITPEGIDPGIIRRLGEWESAFQERDAPARAALVTEIKQAYEAYVDIPF
jgi:hypothetical protein